VSGLTRLRFVLLILGAGLVPAAARCEPAQTYQRLSRDGDYEVRAYPARLVAEVEETGERDDATSRGYQELLTYIRTDKTVTFIAPVTRIETSLGWKVQFNLPADRSPASLPVPATPEVRLRSLPAQTFVAVSFSGTADMRRIEPQLHRAVQYALTHGMVLNGPPQIAFFNAPTSLWMLKHTEVLIPIDPPP
jgi:hypothetical protein